jgi:hypothetical protein
MHVLGLALAGVLALSAPMVAPADPLVSARADAAPALVRIWDGSGSGQRSAPGNQHRTFGHARQWIGGWVPRCWGPSGGWVPYCEPGVPIYWVWGPNGGAFDYPFADWRGPDGGWGNP